MAPQPFKRNQTQHSLALADWLARAGAQGNIDAASQQLRIQLGNREVTLYPQFVRERADGQIEFTDALCADVSGFAGWRPYRQRAWPEAQDKLAFKAWAARHGLPTPAWTQAAGQPTGTVLVKQRRSTFGQGQRGPFNVPPHTLVLAAGEYAEQFIPGQLIKAWCVGPQFAALERVPMPSVRGDGIHSVAQLVAQRCPRAIRFDSAMLQLLALQGTHPDAVPAAGQALWVDYRYMGPLNPATVSDHNQLEALRVSPLAQGLREVAQAAMAGLPQEQRRDTVYSIDGVQDAQGRPWWLEINCNPLLHPACYSTLLDTLFGVEPSAALAQSPPLRA